MPYSNMELAQIAMDLYGDGPNAEIMSRTENEKLWMKINESSPSDHIDIGDNAEKFSALWCKNDTNNKEVPSDLFFCETIPILDCIMTNANGGSFRVVIFSDYAKLLHNTSAGQEVCIGACISDADLFSMVFTINGCIGENYLHIGKKMGYKISKSIKAETFAELPQKLLTDYGNKILSAWYGIQIALLHPLVQTIFQHPEKEMIYDGSTEAKKKKRVTKYIKKHVIKADDIDASLQTNGFTRKTFVWYVIGHWRVYQDGRKVFVHPYWKGPMRNLKKNVDDGREREICFPCIRG